MRYFNVTNQAQSGATDVLNLFGWHLGREILDFLSATGAELDVDEYDVAEDDDAG
ncbi:hypothetical protein ACFWWC_17105 [Streptomyces sp. NPDC058642]|uniref:hypothetical protein n=1 Tax=Streptomyces sp. NPDC058642 TaxID=3346572 RepID=UPI003647EBB5